MNKENVGLAGAFLVAVCVGSTCMAQEAGHPAQLAQSQNALPKEPLPKGTLRITSSALKGSFVIEVNQAPLESVLQAIARQANRHLIISDEAQQKLAKITVFSNNLKETTADEAFDRFAKGSFSWGRLGQDSYLLVPRLASPVEMAVEQAGVSGVTGRAGAYKLMPPSKTETKKPEQKQLEPKADTPEVNPFLLLGAVKGN